MARDGQNGFSLIEALVAMTVLAVSATAILSAAEAHTRSVTAVHERTLARWVAQNAMTGFDERLDVPDIMQMGRMEWRVRTDQTDTRDPDIGRLDITVALAAAPDVVLARLTGFVDVAEGPAE